MKHELHAKWLQIHKKGLAVNLKILKEPSHSKLDLLENDIHG
jgi:hypothetical protein